MILNNTGSTVTTVGDVTEHQISIDAKNIEHIISILSTNLYSHPEQSFLREIVCNAIDAQVEANSKEPAIISMTTDRSSGKHVIAIRDYGTGISPERFKDIYLNIGSSTKRDTNDFIGSFGVGRFSALACADMVHVTSYYEGTQYQYLMLKNGTKINIDLIAEVPTDEPNGVEVKIQVNFLYSYSSALKYLWFIPNLYVHDEYVESRYSYGDSTHKDIERFNNRVLCQFNTFAYNNTEEDKTFVLLGNILYPIDTKYIPAEYMEGYRTTEFIWKYIIPKFKIGELDITPNREQLLYSDKTKDAIAKKYKEVAEELIEICKQISNESFDNIFDFHNAITTSYIALKLPNNAGIDAQITISDDCFLRKYINYKYKNDDPLAKDKEVNLAVGNIGRMSPSDIFNNVTIFHNGSFLTQRGLDRRYYWLANSLHNIEIRLFFVPSMQGLKSDIFKSYLQEKAKAFNEDKEVMFIFTTDNPHPRKFIHIPGIGVPTETSSSKIDWHKSIWLYREIRELFQKKAFVYDIYNSKDFTTYRQSILNARKEERKNRVHKFNSRTRFYVEAYDSHCFYPSAYNKIDAEDIKGLIRDLNSDIKYRIRKNIVPVYWGIDGDPYIEVWKNFNAGQPQAFAVVKVAKTNAKYLEKAELPENWYRITPELIANSRKFRKWMTYKKYGMVLKYDSIIEGLCEYSCSKEDDAAFRLYRSWQTFISREERFKWLDKFIELEANYKGYYDQEMITMYEVIDKYNKLAKVLAPILKLTDYRVTLLTVYTAMKWKLFRPNWETYQQITEILNPKEEVKENEENN